MSRRIRGGAPWTWPVQDVLAFVYTALARRLQRLVNGSASSPRPASRGPGRSRVRTAAATPTGAMRGTSTASATRTPSPTWRSSAIVPASRRGGAVADRARAIGSLLQLVRHQPARVRLPGVDHRRGRAPRASPHRPVTDAAATGLPRYAAPECPRAAEDRATRWLRSWTRCSASGPPRSCRRRNPIDAPRRAGYGIEAPDH
jgi:hypothetical protein